MGQPTWQRDDLPLGTWLHQEEVDSTNSWARRLTDPSSRLELPLLLTCDRQTAGRGRGNNQWQHSAGNLAFSVLCRRADLGEQAHWLALWTAVCLRRCTASFLPAARCEIKWPNDLMVQDRKNAGILIESAGADAVITGVGLNLVRPLSPTGQQLGEEGDEFSWFSWDQWECFPDRWEVLHCFLRDWLRLEFRSRQQQQDLLDQFHQFDWLKGHQISLASGGQNLRGWYQGLNDQGFLQLAVMSESPSGCSSTQVTSLASAEHIRRFDRQDQGSTGG